MGGEEKRVHARVEVVTEIRVSGPEGFQEGELRDLSKGGAGVWLEQPAGQIGDTLELFLPFPGGIEIAVMAEILRVTQTGRGYLHGVRFQLVEPAMREKLIDLIESLLKSKGSETRKHARVSHRIPIQLGKLSDLQATVENISMGGLAMVVKEPLVLDEEVEVTIPDTNGEPLLLLKGKVINQHHVEDHQDRYRVGLEFKGLTEVARACLRQLLESILKVKNQENS